MHTKFCRVPDLHISVPMCIRNYFLHMLDQVTSPLEATSSSPSPFIPPTPPIPLTPQSLVSASSPQLSTGVGGLLSTNHLEGAKDQPLSLEEEIMQFEKKYEDLVIYVLSAFKTGRVSVRGVLNCLVQLPVSLKLQCDFLQSQAARLCQASTIDELFFILSPHWDFLNS